MYNAVLGDGDWKSYYAKRKQQAGKAYDDTEIRAELAALEKKIDSIKLPDSSGSTSSYDDTAIWEDVNIAKDDIKKCTVSIGSIFICSIGTDKSRHQCQRNHNEAREIACNT